MKSKVKGRERTLKLGIERKRSRWRCVGFERGNEELAGKLVWEGLGRGRKGEIGLGRVRKAVAFIIV